MDKEYLGASLPEHTRDMMCAHTGNKCRRASELPIHTLAQCTLMLAVMYTASLETASGSVVLQREIVHK